MKHIIFSFLMIFALCSLTSCNSEKSKPVKIKKTQTIAKKKKTAKGINWNEVQKSLSLTNSQTKQLKAIQVKYGKQVKALKAKKKYTAEAKKATSAKKQVELKKLLGKKYKAFVKILAQHNKKSSKKGVNKKAVSKKKKK